MFLIRTFTFFHKDSYRNRHNLYTSTSEHIVYHRVKKGESLGVIARKHGLSVTELCRLNGLKKTSVLRVGQTLRCGKTSARVSKKATRLKPAQQTVADETAVAKEEKPVYHRVRQGETLYSIARQHSMTVDALCKLNRIRPTDPLHEGQEICYRAVKHSTKHVVKEETEEMVIAEHTASDQLPEEDDKRGSENGIQEDNSVTVTESRQTVAPAQSKVTAAKKTKTAARLKAPVYHRVKKGDTLSAIARRHGVSVEQLCTLNKIQKTTTLKVGRSLRCS